MTVGTAPWVQRTSEGLTDSERRALLRSLICGQVQHVTRRLPRLGHLPGSLARTSPGSPPRHSAESSRSTVCAQHTAALGVVVLSAIPAGRRRSHDPPMVLLPPLRTVFVTVTGIAAAFAEVALLRMSASRGAAGGHLHMH